MDKWGSFQGFMNDFSQLAKNPAQYAMDKMGISQDIANDPDAIIQRWMNEGKVTQDQYNAARKAAGMIQSNPLFSQFMKR
jgi:hypothetical protein